ncbi:MAG: hypothetical protein C0628_04740 [Sulfurimonas sp.]|nr:MAG: hypothetical protein C0628_04740 [Sulfurimonas sp.]
MDGNIQKIESVQNSQIAQNVEGNQIYIDKLLFQEPLQPLFSCNYYNFKDKFILLYMLVPTIVVAMNIFYNIPELAFATYLISGLLLLSRIQNILQIINVYNNFFFLNGIIIPFNNIKDLNSSSLGLQIIYKKDSLTKNLPTKITFIKKEDVVRFKEQYNKAKSTLIN